MLAHVHHRVGVASATALVRRGAVARGPPALLRLQRRQQQQQQQPPAAVASALFSSAMPGSGHGFGTKRFKKNELNYRVAGFPDFIDKWNERKFYGLGFAATAGVVATALLGSPIAAVVCAVPVAGYWYVGLHDLKQNVHTIRKNFPVLGNIRYIFETLRPEFRQYFVEGDHETVLFSRFHRSLAYQRAKGDSDTLPLGCRKDVYECGYEWVNHSMFPTHLSEEDSRVLIGGNNPECLQPYSASIFNVSAMSYGALSDNAILALSTGAAMGGFYHNTGEGGVSRFHLRGGADIVWNVGTGYFGCRAPDGSFSEERFAETATEPNIKMIELKLSQGAKPGHGGLLPAAKITKYIAEARGLGTGPYQDCNSPPSHSAFHDAESMMHFIAKLRTLSGGKPVGIKFCVGRPADIVNLAAAMVKTGITPDFLTVDGGEGGTGAAPPEFSMHVGMPLIEGLALVDSIMIGAGLRDRVKIIAAGKVLTGFSVIRTLANGADLCNSARGMMFALGCIQALKCNTNKCPTGIATQNPRLMAGLVVDDKAHRVCNFQHKTVEATLEIAGAMGLKNLADLAPSMVSKRVTSDCVMTYEEQFPRMSPGELVDTDGLVDDVLSRRTVNDFVSMMHERHPVRHHAAAHHHTVKPQLPPNAV